MDPANTSNQEFESQNFQKMPGHETVGTPWFKNVRTNEDKIPIENLSQYRSGVGIL
jgi:hypothetical protein